MTISELGSMFYDRLEYFCCFAINLHRTFRTFIWTTLINACCVLEVEAKHCTIFHRAMFCVDSKFTLKS